MTSFYGKMMNLIFMCMPQDKEGQPHDYIAERKRNDRKPPRAPKGVIVEKIFLGNLTGEKITKETNTKGWIFYIHGGGFTVGSARERRAICQFIAANYGYNCITFNYRLAPENLWPAPLEDTIYAYQEVLKMGIPVDKLVIMGESAGGTLTLSLALAIKEKGLPMPKALVPFSPCTTVAETLPSHIRNIKTDYMLRDGVAKGKIKTVYGSQANDEVFLRQPLISTLYGNFTHLPPIFISVSDTECLFDDSKYLYEKLLKEGHKIDIDIQHGVCHAFQVFTGMPEAKESIKKVFEFLDQLDK